MSKEAAIKRPVAGSLVVEAALWQPDGAAEEGCSITGGGREASLGTVPPISLSHHMASSCSATGGALCRHLCTLFKCPACVCVCVCGISGCGRGCIVGLPRRPCGAGIDIPQLACPPVPRPAGCGTREWRGTALAVLERHPAQLASPELTPTCHPARFSSQQGQIVKKGSGRFWPLVTLQP